MLRFILSLLLFSLSFSSLFAERGFIVETIGVGKNVETRKKLIEDVLSSDSFHFGYSALSIILDTNLIEPRGQMQGKIIKLSPHVQKESEFLKLLIHEVAHYVDIYRIVPLGQIQDPSSIFYGISWESKNAKKSSESLASFVSGYAATNQYEDFAESFTFYIFHNEEFADRALKNESLRQKYLFFGKYVFPGGSFFGTDFRIGKVPSYLWDTTKVPVSVKKYLYFLAKVIY